jgi:hypothetical protein
MYEININKVIIFNSGLANIILDGMISNEEFINNIEVNIDVNLI